MGKIRRKEDMGNFGNTESMGIMWNKVKAFAMMFMAVLAAVFVAVFPISNETVEASDTVTWTDGDITAVFKDGTLTISGSGEMEDYYSPWEDYGAQITKIVVKEGITRIGEASFYGLSATEVSLPDGLLVIGRIAFHSCTSLTSISIPNTVTTIEEYAFKNCTSLKSLKIPDSVIKIENGAFDGCDSLTLTLPDGMRQIDDGSYIVAADVNITGTQYYDMAWEVLDLVNEERAAAGVDPLVMDGELMEAAMQRAAEISVYYSHTRPTGMSYGTVLSKVSGENIAAGYSSVSSVMSGWMNSTTHRRNILNENYQCIGIGCFEINGVYYWAQDFSRQEADATASVTGSKTKSIAMTLDVSLFNGCVFLWTSSSTLWAGGTATYELYVENASSEWESHYVPLDSSCLTWSTDSSSVATVNSSGKVTAKAGGQHHAHGNGCIFGICYD